MALNAMNLIFIVFDPPSPRTLLPDNTKTQRQIQPIPGRNACLCTADTRKSWRKSDAVTGTAHRLYSSACHRRAFSGRFAIARRTASHGTPAPAGRGWRGFP
jgi:hypothetical protein